MSKYIATTINKTQSRDRSYIYISSADQYYFPEPNEKFRIIDPISDKTYHVHLENSYRIPGLKVFFKSHPEIKKGTKILIEPVEQHKTYNIYIDHIPDELDQTIYLPTEDTAELDKKVESILKKGIIGKPQGQRNPKKQQSSQTSYERDPLVKAWVILAKLSE